MTERTQNGFIVLTEKGKESVDEFVTFYGKNNAEGWNLHATYAEVEESLNNSVIGETLMYELGQFESNNGHANTFIPADTDIEYQPIAE